MLVALSAIQRDSQLQARAGGIDPEHVARLAEALRDEAILPPVLVFQGEGDAELWLADGWHRVAAALEVGRKDIEADIRPGGRRAAFVAALGANPHHGLPRTREDKRRAVDLALHDAELGALPDREIARITATSHTFVATRRALMVALQQQREAEARSRALGLAKARGHLIGALGQLVDWGVETLALPTGERRIDDMIPEIATWERGAVDLVLAAAGEAARAHQRPRSAPTPTPAPTRAEPLEPTRPPAEERRADSRARGERIGRVLSRARALARTGHDTLYMGGDVGTIELSLVLDSHPTTWDEDFLAALERSLYPVEPRHDQPQPPTRRQCEALTDPVTSFVVPPEQAEELPGQVRLFGLGVVGEVEVEPSPPARDPRRLPEAGDMLPLPEGDGTVRVVGVRRSPGGWDVTVREHSPTGTPLRGTYGIPILEWWRHSGVDQPGNVSLQRDGYDRVLVWRQGVLPEYAGRPVETLEQALALLDERRTGPSLAVLRDRAEALLATLARLGVETFELKGEPLQDVGLWLDALGETPLEELQRALPAIDAAVEAARNPMEIPCPPSDTSAPASPMGTTASASPTPAPTPKSSPTPASTTRPDGSSTTAPAPSTALSPASSTPTLEAGPPSTGPQEPTEALHAELAQLRRDLATARSNEGEAQHHRRRAVEQRDEALSLLADLAELVGCAPTRAELAPRVADAVDAWRARQPVTPDEYAEIRASFLAGTAPAQEAGDPALAIYRPWRRSADELAAHLEALPDPERELVRAAHQVRRGARLVERLTMSIMSASVSS